MFNFPGTVNLFCLSREDLVLTNLSAKSVDFLKPILNFFVGEFSPQQRIEFYLKSIEKCIEFVDNTFKNVPMVINTHGYIKNIGKILFFDIEKII